MIAGIKNGLFLLSTVLVMMLHSGCEVLDKLQAKDSELVETAAVQKPRDADLDLASAPVIEPIAEQSSGWRPILPHELDAQFEESEILVKLFRYSRRLGEMTSQQLDQEYQSYRNLTEEQKSAVNMQLQYALLLSNSMAGFRDDESAKKILTGIINSEKKRGVMLREYAYNLLVSIDQNEKAEQQNLLLRKKLKSEIERREALEQKLEALKSIEESITQRQNNPEEVKP